MSRFVSMIMSFITDALSVKEREFNSAHRKSEDVRLQVSRLRSKHNDLGFPKLVSGVKQKDPFNVLS